MLAAGRTLNLLKNWQHMKTLKRLAAAAALIALSGAAQAALVNRGGGMIYDTTRNITWLANMNTTGLMTWAAATTWANNLVHGGFDDWRLPTLNPADTTCSLILIPPPPASRIRITERAAPAVN